MVTLTLSVVKGKRNPSMHFRQQPRTFHVYIMIDRSQTLYTGVTSKLEVRAWQHKNHVFEGFTSRYGLDRLVYYEAFSRIGDAIARERQIKGWTRVKKMALIVSMNPTWRDLSEDWGKPAKMTFQKPKSNT